MTPELVIAIAIPAVLQVGAFLFYAGSTWAMLRQHEKRLDRLERANPRSEWETL